MRSLFDRLTGTFWDYRKTYYRALPLNAVTISTTGEVQRRFEYRAVDTYTRKRKDGIYEYREEHRKISEEEYLEATSKVQ
jgi:hypothetical protein